MKVNNLVSLAAKCNSESEAQNLLFTLKGQHTNVIGQLRATCLNEDSSLNETGNADLSFEMCHELSSHFIVFINPSLRGGDYSVRVGISQMDDGMGFGSQHWHTPEDMEHFIEGKPDDNIGSLACEAIEKAIELHVELIQRTGVPESYAKDIARHVWQ